MSDILDKFNEIEKLVKSNAELEKAEERTAKRKRKKYEKNPLDELSDSYGQAISLDDFYRRSLSGLSRRQVGLMHDQVSDYRFNRGSTNLMDRYDDFARQAADNADEKGKYLDSEDNKKDILGSGYKTFESWLLGYNQMLFAKPVPYQKKEYKPEKGQYAVEKAIGEMSHTVSEAWKKQLATNAGEAFNKFINPDQEYSFLYPARDPETGEPTLKEFIGTKRAFRETGLDAYTTFGLQAQSDHLYGVGELLKTGANQLLGTDDLLLAGAKGLQDITKSISPWSKLDDGKETTIDRMHRIALEDTAQNSYINSDRANDIGSLEWLGSGAGSILASFAQFGGTGAAIRGSLQMAGSVLTSTLGREVLKQGAIATASRYGASGLIGFGSAYNTARSEGLNEKESLAFGLVVGGASSFIESTGLMGKTDIVDKWLLGGGQRALGAELLRNIKGEAKEITQEVLEKGLKATLPKVMDALKKVPAANYVRPMLEEGGEEGAQTLTEMVGKVAFDGLKGLYDKDAVVGKGKFGQEMGVEELKEILSASLIGAMGGGGMAFVMGNSQKDMLSTYIQEGRVADLKAGMDTLLNTDQITPLQHQNYNAYIDGLNKVYGEHREAFDHIKDKEIQKEIWSHLHLARQLQMQSEADDQKAIAETVKVGDENSTAMTPATEAQKKAILDLRESSQKKKKLADDTLAGIDKYMDPNYVSTRREFLDKAKEEQTRLKNNAFEQYVKPAEGPEENWGKLYGRVIDNEAVPFRHAVEINHALRMLEEDPSMPKLLSPDERADLILAIQRSLNTKGNNLLHSPLVNTEANRPLLEAAGIDLSALPLTALEQKAYEQSLKAGTPDPALAGRTYTSDEFNSLKQAAADDLNKDEADKSKHVSRDSAEALEHLMQNAPNFDVDLTRMASRSNEDRALLGDIFGKDSAEMTVLDAMEKTSGKALILVVEDVPGLKQPDGFYQAGSGTLVMRFDKAKAAKNKAYRKKVFALAVHENTHGLFDQALRKGELHYIKWLNGGKPTPEAIQFQRLLKLAELAFHALADKGGSKGSYFLNDIGPQAITQLHNKDSKRNTALLLVKEFFAEALSNEDFQKQLGSFDMNGKKNKALVDSKYGYTQFNGGKHTLMQEVYNALKSVFASLRGMLTKSQRTLLSESYDMASTINMSYFHVTPEVQIEGELSFQDFSSRYAPQLIADGVNQDLDELADRIMNTFATMNDSVMKAVATNPEKRAQFQRNFDKFLADHVLDTAEPGTDKLIYFKNTNDLLLVWEDESGAQHRQFFNAYGSPVGINSNVFNRDVSNTLRKPDYLQTFSGSYSDPINKLNREILNNLDQAQRENFEGKLELVLSDRTWHFNGEDIKGQVEVIYTSKNGNRLQIGWMPDLTKVRLAGLLSKGARVALNIDEVGKGSKAFVQRDEQGLISDVKQWRDGLQPPAGYALERVMPNISLAFGRVEGLKSTDALPDDGDQFTFNDGQHVDTSPAAFTNWRDRVIGAAVDEDVDYEAAEWLNRAVSHFKPETITDPNLRETLEFYNKVITRRIRRFLAFSPVQEHSLAKAKDRANASILHLNKTLAEQFPDDQQSQHLGLSEAELNTYLNEMIAKQGRAVHNYADRQGQQDWDGHGTNPHNAVSAKIKYDLETVSYTYKEKHYMLDYSEASEVLYQVARGTDTFEELMESLLAYSENDTHSEFHRTIAQALYRHMSAPMATDKAMLEAARNTYWSQFASYTRRDGVVAQMAGTGVKVYYASQSQELNDLMEADARALRSKAEEIRRAWEASDKSLSLVEFYEVMTGTEARSNAKGYTSHIGMIGNMRSTITGQQLGSDGISGSTMSDAEYEKKSRLLVDYLKFLGIEVPASLLTRKRIDDTNHGQSVQAEMIDFKDSLQLYYKRELATLKKQGLPAEEYDLKRKAFQAEYKQQLADKETELNALPTNRYGYQMAHFVRDRGGSFKAKGKERASSYTYFELYTQIADRAHMDMKLALAGKATDTKNMQDLKDVRQRGLEQTGNYKSPAFYLDTNLNKRWAMKIKAYTEHLLERLKLNKGGLLRRYQSSRMYEHNIIIKQLAENPDSVRWEAVGGLISPIHHRHNTDYTGASKMDFVYMHLAYFVGGGTEKYRHIEDVPSDKPQPASIQIAKIQPDEYASQLQNIIDMESQRLAIAEEYFSEKNPDRAFDELPDGSFVVVNDEVFRSLVPGVHYKESTDSKGYPVYHKGHIFDKSNYFFNGADVNAILAEMKEQTREHYLDYTKKGLVIPVSAQFLKQHEQIQKEHPEQYAQLLEAEQKRVFRDYTYNYTINRYHLTQLQMGDYIFYKQKNKAGESDEFADLNKRHAGAGAPFQRGVWNRKTASMAILTDEEIKGHRLPAVVRNEDGTFTVQEGQGATINSNRGDAQAYMTESFLEEVKAAYGSFASYDSPLKPVLFGVNEEFLDEARPFYLKMSMIVVPNPYLEKNAAFYEAQPEYLAFAEKFYSEGVDTAIFESGTKVGAPARTARTANEWNVQAFDLNLFGLQNNPSHHADSESTISAGVQLEKQLGDNGNFDAMLRYHAIVSNILAGKAGDLFDNKLANSASVYEYLREQLASQAHTEELARSLDADLRLDNPVVATLFENMINALVNKVVSSPRKDGEKLVNASDLGFNRPLTEADKEALRQGMEPEHVKQASALRWKGPRRFRDLTENQKDQVLERVKAEGAAKVFEKGDETNGHIIGTDGQVQIFPADILVPAGRGYTIGQQLISNRVPGSAKNSAIAGEVVGFLPESMGNLIVTPKEGPGILGFDFDIDGLFSWRKDKATPEMQEMFDVAWSVLLSPNNFAEVTTPVSTDELQRLADIFGERRAKREPKTSRFMPFRQFNLKNQNTVGKDMIGITAKAYGMWSVFSQTNVTLTASEMAMVGFTFNARAYNLDGVPVTGFPQKDSQGRPVFDSFQQTLNAATDNVKEMALGRIGLNQITSAVYMDMLSHGFSLEHVGYFLNQEIISELVDEKERQGSATFTGDRDSAFDVLVARWEAKARAFDPKYEYNPMHNGVSQRDDVIYAYKERAGFMTELGPVEPEVLMSKVDRRTINLQKLQDLYEYADVAAEERNNPRAELRYIDLQLAILEKFKYYTELAGVSSKGGAIVSLASSYPKTFLEVWNTYRKTKTVLGEWNGEKWAGQKINISGLTGDRNLEGSKHHPYFAFQFQTLRRVLGFYSEHRLYAQEAFIKLHEEVAGDKSLEMQETVMKDFYTYLLTAQPLFNTESFNGQRLTAEDFVHATANTVRWMKANGFGEHEFLRHISVKDGVYNNTEGSKVPDMLKFQQLYDMDSEELDRVYKAWEELPGDLAAQDLENPEYQESLLDMEGERVDVKRLLLGYLAHTSGFNAGGFTFARLLPPAVKKELDRGINNFTNKYYSAQFDLNNTLWIEQLFDDQTFELVQGLSAEVDFELTEEEIAMGEDAFSQEVTGLSLFAHHAQPGVRQVFEDAGFQMELYDYIASRYEALSEEVTLSDFRKQVYLNNPEMISSLPELKVKQLLNEGLARRRPNGEVVLSKNDMHGVAKAIYDQVERGGMVVKMRMGEDAERREIIYEASYGPGDSLILTPTSFEKVKGVKQYYRGTKQVQELPISPAFTPSAQEFNVQINGEVVASTEDIWAGTQEFGDASSAQEYTIEELDALMRGLSHYQPSRIPAAWKEEFANLPVKMSIREFLTAKKRQHEC